MCSVTIKKTGKQVNLGLCTVFSSLFIILWLEISGDFSQAKFISPVRKFCEKDKLFMVIQPKDGKI